MFSDKSKSYSAILNRKTHLFKKKGNLQSRLFLYFSNLLMLMGFLTIYLESTGFFSREDYFFREPWAGWVLFLIGIMINFFSIPVLYWSSLEKFKKGDEFWDRESFWILPLFFFGSFFQYLSNLPYVMVILPFSLLLIFIVHIWVMILSKDLIAADDQFQNSMEYFKSLTYLTSYYLICTVMVVFFDLFEKFKYWLR